MIIFTDNQLFKIQVWGTEEKKEEKKRRKNNDNGKQHIHKKEVKEWKPWPDLIIIMMLGLFKCFQWIEFINLI